MSPDSAWQRDRQPPLPQGAFQLRFEVISRGARGPFVEGVTIESISVAWDGAAAFNLQPRWQRFGG
jgi:hypothetical protein